MRVGLIGFGIIGHTHLSVYQSIPDIDLVAIVDIDEEKRAEIEALGFKYYSSFERFLENETVDYVDLCTPSFVHKEQAILALSKKIPVLCEKPIALHPSDAKAMADCAKENDTLLMIAQVIRFWPEYRLAKNFIDNKTLGNLDHGSFSRVGVKPKHSWKNWMLDDKLSGNVLLDLHIHDADFIYDVFGKSKETHILKQYDKDRMSYFNVNYEYDNFFISSEAAWYDCDYPFNMSYRLVFEKGILEYKNGQTYLYHKDGRFEEMNVSNMLNDLGEDIQSTNGYENEILYFIDCLKNSKKPKIVTPEQCVEVLHILNYIAEAK